MLRFPSSSRRNQLRGIDVRDVVNELNSLNYDRRILVEKSL